jgi:dihydroorotate dehydrogenase/NAD-dependent dihydropyrimidine dehydrogenase PreA subunit
MVKPVDLMGLHLKSPIIVAAGPWSRDGRSIQQCIDAGPGAVITETITLEANPTICPRLYAAENRIFNTKLYSHLHLEQWEEEVESVDKRESKLICSIWGSSVSELSYLAKKVEILGADAIEISISAPIGTRNQAIHNHSPFIHEYVKAVVDAVDIPVMVKLSYEAAISPEFVHSIQQAGITAVSAIDGMKGLMGVDIETRAARMPTYGGYTGTQIRPISLATTASLKQRTPFQICSVGGISTSENALEFIMLGAQAVQIASVILLEGYGAIGSIISGVEAWLAEHGYSDYPEIRGAALASLRPFEDLSPAPLKAAVKERCTSACEICLRGCIYHAIHRDGDGAIRIDPDACSGCGWCVARCPENKLELRWM